MLPVILVAVGAYLIGDSVLGDKKSYADGGMMAKGGATKNIKSRKDLVIGEISSMTGLRKEGIERFSDENELTDSDLSNIMQGLGRKMINKDDFSTAVVGDKDNSYATKIVEFAKSNKGYKMAKGGKLVGKQKNLDVNKNGKLDAEDFKMLRGEKMAKGGEASTKNFNTMMNVGKSKYVINYHNGEKTHKDGSPFYDLATFKNKKDFDARKKALINEGYKEM